MGSTTGTSNEYRENQLRFEALPLLLRTDYYVKILPTETQLNGKWLISYGQIIADPICDKIDDLIKSHLKKISHDASGWDTLYLDPNDNRLWELTYPEGELQGGGPPQLRLVSPEDAQRKYGLSLPLKILS